MCIMKVARVNFPVDHTQHIFSQLSGASGAQNFHFPALPQKISDVIVATAFSVMSAVGKGPSGRPSAPAAASTWAAGISEL